MRKKNWVYKISVCMQIFQNELHICANIFSTTRKFHCLLQLCIFWLFLARKLDSKCLISWSKVCACTRQVFNKTCCTNKYWLNGLNKPSIPFARLTNSFGLTFSSNLRKFICDILEYFILPKSYVSYFILMYVLNRESKAHFFLLKQTTY